jgi:hypothetical protein
MRPMSEQEGSSGCDGGKVVGCLESGTVARRLCCVIMGGPNRAKADKGTGKTGRVPRGLQGPSSN